ncbi:MAG: Fic family protein [Desulfobacteraceae bacterium]|jgi:Fic family protein|nr:Fic family protein [Desulfobacteraceae bacterium]
MKIIDSAKKAAKRSGNPRYDLTPLLPGNDVIGPLKDMAQEIIAASAGLEGRVATETATALGDQLRLINSYYSNLIEGHKTTIPDIEMALRKEFNRDPEKKYAQELCAAHVETEKQFMQIVDTTQKLNVCDQKLLSDIHAAFYADLPKEHLYTHTQKGFSKAPVLPGEFRDVNVSVDGQSPHGPDYRDLPLLLQAFSQGYDPDRFHGDDQLIAMAASHHRLTWLHPFRDGNGRVARLFSGLYLSEIGINKSNLWSLSRGLSRNKNRYMFELWTTDSPGKQNSGYYFDNDLSADFCEFFFAICLDQIRFMENLLRLDQIEARIDWYVEARSKNGQKPLRDKAAKLLRAVFMRGALPRGKVAEILNMSARSARRTVSALIDEGLLQSKSHRAPLTIGLPIHVLPYYFPDLYDPSVIGVDPNRLSEGSQQFSK